MHKNTRIIATATLVALAGGAMAFFALSARGRDALRRVVPALDDVSHSFEDVRTIVRKLEDLMREAGAMVTDIRDAMPSMRADDDLEHPPQSA